MVGDGASQVLGWKLTAGQAGDAPQAAGLLARWLAPAQQVLGDAAYNSDALRALIAQAGATAVIQPNPRLKNLPIFDRVAYKERHHIERTFSKFKQFRRIATRYDKLARSFDAFICLRVISLYLN